MANAVAALTEIAETSGRIIIHNPPVHDTECTYPFWRWQIILCIFNVLYYIFSIALINTSALLAISCYSMLRVEYVTAMYAHIYIYYSHLFCFLYLFQFLLLFLFLFSIFSQARAWWTSLRVFYRSYSPPSTNALSGYVRTCVNILFYFPLFKMCQRKSTFFLY